MLINDNNLLPSLARYLAAAGLQQRLHRAMILGHIFSVEADLHTTPPDDQACLTIKRQHPGQIYKIRITEPEPGPVQIENAAGPLPDSGRNRLPGTKGQSASALGM
jgi:hypothetical protein